MKRVLLFTNEEIVKKSIEKIIQDMDCNVSIYCTGDRASAYKYAIENSVDMFIVDVDGSKGNTGYMPGMILATHIREICKYKNASIVAIGSLENADDFVYEEIGVLKYLSKPVHIREGKAVFKKVLEGSHEVNGEKFVFFRNDKKLCSIKVENIVYAVSKDGKLSIVTTDGMIELYSVWCKTLLEKAHSDNLLQCNRNTIVNRRFIDCVNKSRNYIKLTGKYGSIKIGTIMKKDFLLKLRD